MYQKQKKTTTRSLLFHQKPLAFHQKTLQNIYFSGKSEKTQKNPRFFEKPQEKPQVSKKKPRTLDRVEKPQIWGENPRIGNAAINSLQSTTIIKQQMLLF